MEAIITVGIPRSGKSLYAKSLANTHKEINRDNARLLLSGCKSKRDYWNLPKNEIKKYEKEVTKYCTSYISLCALSGFDIICSDTNLNEKLRDELIFRLETIGYDVTIKEFDITFEQAMKYNEKSGDDYVAKSVMTSMWRKWLDYKNHKHAVFHEGLEEIYLVDIDGTVADHKGIRSPFDWPSVKKDIPKLHVISVVKSLISSGKKIVFMSGRESVCMEDTIEWIKDHITDDVEIYMRAEGDRRKDNVVKRELYDNHIGGRYNVVGVFDDRLQVVRMWRDMGLTVFCVGDIDDEF